MAWVWEDSDRGLGGERKLRKGPGTLRGGDQERIGDERTLNRLCLLFHLDLGLSLPQSVFVPL